jgi:hypothetical protein
MVALASQKERAHRDLLWAIQSPVLCGQTPPRFEEWAKRDLDLVSLSEETIRMRRIPIGRYFEGLVGDWLRAQCEVHKLATNLQIRSNQSTLGEVDLLFESQGRCVHWELALKFYLGTGDRLKTGNWFGPQGRDRLDLKLHKLNSRQLRLLDSPEGKEMLKERGLSSPEAHALIKGYLFHPFADWKRALFPVPPEVNPQHAHGWWIHESDLGNAIERHDAWQVLPKIDWLAPAKMPSARSKDQILAWVKHHFEHDQRPPMLVALDPSGLEVERGFVVPDSWDPAPR